MKLPRRQFLHVAAGAATLSFAPRIAQAQTYPTRPVRIIVGFPAGGGGDIVARLMGQWLSERLGQLFVIDNRPGAATNIATEAVVHGAADGYTLLLVHSSNATNATLYEKLNFNFIRDIAPVASIMLVPNVAYRPRPRIRWCGPTLRLVARRSTSAITPKRSTVSSAPRRSRLSTIF
jgi:tripartite-type tricarboxylate transporter receptor subunit TctC